MRYRRYYIKKNRNGSVDVVSVGPVARAAKSFLNPFWLLGIGEKKRTTKESVQILGGWVQKARDKHPKK